MVQRYVLPSGGDAVNAVVAALRKTVLADIAPVEWAVCGDNTAASMIAPIDPATTPSCELW